MPKISLKELDILLSNVKKPSRYIGNEFNCVIKNWDNDSVKVCLCFPDLYELAFSNLGLQILYNILNSKEKIIAERCYLPDIDMIEEIKANSLHLFSLETKHFLSEFDIVGFSLQYELCYTNVIEMLNLSGIPIFSEERKSLPLIVAGGPCSVNPEPISDFIDAFCIGDGEETILKIVKTVSDFKKNIDKKDSLLKELTKIPGVYVPKFYKHIYSSQSEIKQIINLPPAPQKVKSIHKSINEYPYPLKPILPFTIPVHNKLNIEIQRGCPWSCRFCSATKVYNKYREREKDNIKKIIFESIKNSGYDEITLSGLSVADYSEMHNLLNEITKDLFENKIRISIPSTRCNRMNVLVASEISHFRHSGLTLAPEAGSQRLRNFIGKGISEEEIMESFLLAKSLGWKRIKLYFMYGLPTETMDDIKEIVRLIKTARKITSLDFSITLSPFVPKPHTTFQWYPQESMDSLKMKKEFLMKNLPCQIKFHNLEQTIIESLFSRGDRRLSSLIYRAWKNNCILDAWSDYFSYPRWLKSFEEANTDINFYLYRNRTISEIFPWDTIELNWKKEYILRDYLRISNERVDSNISNKLFNKNFNINITIPSKNLSLTKYRIRFGRYGLVRFLSHLEQIEVFRKLLRRTNLPLKFSEGFHPQICTSFGPALPVGYESDCEYVDVIFTKKIPVEDIKDKIQKELPYGFKLFDVKQIPVNFPSLDSYLNVVDYEINLNGFRKEINLEFLITKEFFIEKNHQRINIIPLIKKIKQNGNSIFMRLFFGPNKTVKPDLILKEILNDELILNVRRKELFAEINNKLYKP